ncbi:MAG TPA: hypothetical protein VJT68_01130, partial [Thermoleophilaceae bacterium]|nr:hypothetical protein [Thermoleophilaceae bacterium]
DIYDVFGGELRTIRLFAGGSSEDAGLGVSATNVVSFGEDACAHIYVATIGGTVYRLEPASGPLPCAPQTPRDDEPDPGGTAPTDNTQPTTTVQPVHAKPTCMGVRATIVGTRHDDVRRGTPRRDVIAGLAGNDRLYGLAGNDLICGGRGNDRLYGQRGRDTLSGNAGRDTLRGGPGKDILRGGPGRDRQR